MRCMRIDQGCVMLLISIRHFTTINAVSTHPPGDVLVTRLAVLLSRRQQVGEEIWNKLRLWRVEVPSISTLFGPSTTHIQTARFYLLNSQHSSCRHVGESHAKPAVHSFPAATRPQHPTNSTPPLHCHSQGHHRRYHKTSREPPAAPRFEAEVEDKVNIVGRHPPVHAPPSEAKVEHTHRSTHRVLRSRWRIKSTPLEDILRPHIAF